MSAWDVTVARKKPFSRLSGVFDSIGAQERCLEFIEFVIFGLGVKRAPVCCRKTQHQSCPPHLPMTADAQGQPSSSREFLFFFQSGSHITALCTLFISKHSWEDICQLYHKSLPRGEKVTPGYGRKNAAISGQVQIKVWGVVDTDHPHELDQSKGPLNIQTLQCDSQSLAVGKLANSNWDCVLF